MSSTPSPAEEYQRQFTVAADALEAAIRTGATDGGEIVSHLLATVAANLGGMHTITAARSGSWEADYVDQMLRSTVGYDGEHLLAYRTHAIEVVECIDGGLFDNYLDGVYDDSVSLIDDYEMSHTSDADYDAALDRVDAARVLIERLAEADYTAYRRAYDNHVATAAEELRRDRSLPTSVDVRVRWVPGNEADQTTRSREDWGTVEHELAEKAFTATPPPGFDAPIDWSKGEPVDQLRAAGRLPHQRIPKLAHYAHLTAQHEQDSTNE